MKSLFARRRHRRFKFFPLFIFPALCCLPLLPILLGSCDFIIRMQGPADPVFEYTGNLAADFPFDGNFLDASGNNNSLNDISTGYSPADDRFGNPNSAHQFPAEPADTNTLYLEQKGTSLESEVFTATIWLFFNDNFYSTLFFWAVPELSFYHGHESNSEYGDSAFSFKIDYSSTADPDNNVGTIIYGNNEQIYNNEIIFGVEDVLKPNDWNFIALTVDYLGNASYYINGIKMGHYLLPTGSRITPDKYILIMQDVWESCRIDDLRIYDHPSTPAQIESLYTAEKP